MKKKIKKIVTSLPESWSEDTYKRLMNKYIADYVEYENERSVGFFSLPRGGYVSKPDVGKAKWDKIYPNGYESWLQARDINPMWVIRELAAKVNELIDVVNKLK